MKIGDLVRHRYAQIGIIVGYSEKTGWQVVWLDGGGMTFKHSESLEVINEK